MGLSSARNTRRCDTRWLLDVGLVDLEPFLVSLILYVVSFPPVEFIGRIFLSG